MECTHVPGQSLSGCRHCKLVARVPSLVTAAKEHGKAAALGQLRAEMMPREPGLLQKVASLAGAVVRDVAAGCPRVSEEVRLARLSMCEACPFNSGPPGRPKCQGCGCGAGLPTKAGMALEKCPHPGGDRWAFADANAPPAAWDGGADSALTAWIWSQCVSGNEYRLPDRMGGWAVLDVGAQTGTFAHAAASRGAAVIHCYEPDAASLAALLHNAAAARGVRVFAEAVCASGGRASPATSAVPGVGVLHASDPAGLAPAVTLATAIERLAAAAPSKRVDLLKIDCEGCEVAALVGADLSLVDRIAGEWHGDTMHAVGPALEAAGFAVEELPPHGGDTFGLFFAHRPSGGEPVARYDNRQLIGRRGKKDGKDRRYNASILADPLRPGRWLMAYRDEWSASEIYLARLAPDFRVESARLLPLRHDLEAAAGREDPRLFMHDGAVHVAFIGVSTGRNVHTSQLYARLAPDLSRADAAHYAMHPARQKKEKNWSFFSHGGELLAVYAPAPTHRVVQLDGPFARPAWETPNPFAERWGQAWGEMRGGAPPVLVGDEYWHFFHSSYPAMGTKVYTLGLYTFDASPPFAPRRFIPHPLAVADPATNPGNYCPVIFPGGAARQGDSWLVSCGVHDMTVEIYRYSHHELESRLISTPRPGATGRV